VLKNAIDWASRPHLSGALLDKPVAAVGTSSGRYGGEWALDDTRKTARIAGARVLDDIVALAVPAAAARFAATHPADDDKSPPRCSTSWWRWPQPPELLLRRLGGGDAHNANDDPIPTGGRLERPEAPRR